MKSRSGRDDSCSCSSCFYKYYKTNKGIERTGSKIDRLYRDKYLPLRESKLIDKLERTRAVYDDIRAPFLDDSEINRNIAHTKRSGSSESCNCCRCTRKFNNISGHSDVSSIYTRQNSKRRVRFKPEFIKSDPCVCLAKFGSLLKKQSKNLQSKLKREFSAPVLRIKIKEPSSYKINRASSRKFRESENFNNASRIVNPQIKSVISERKLFPKKKSGIKTNSDEMLKLSVKKPSKSRHRVGDVKYKNKNGGPKYQKALDPILCLCPQEKLVLKIRKDSIRKFYEDLEKKRTLKHLECKSDCVQDICIPKECLNKIKLSDGKKSTKKRPKSLKQIVSKASRRKKKTSVICQCDDTITNDKNQTPVRQNLVKFVSSKKDIRNKSLKGNTAALDRLESKTADGNRSLKQIVSKASRRKKKTSVICQCDDTITNDKNQTPVRQNLVKFVSSKKDIRNKSLKGNTAALDRLESKTADGNRLKRCFCTLKFKQAEPKKYTPTPDNYPHSGQSGDMKISSTQMHTTAKKSKSSCSVYGCDPNECIEEYKKRKRQTANNDFNKLNENNRRVVRFGSSISFNIEFFKENKPKDTHKSVKTNTAPHNLSSKSIKSIGARKSNKNFSKNNNKRKVTILDNVSKNGGLEKKMNSNKMVRKLRKYAKRKSKVQSSSKDFKIDNEMVDQSTKITNKDMRHMKSFECESQICIPGNCDPRLCLEKRNKQKHEITTTDFPKMISVASGVHKRKLKHAKAQSKSSFRNRNSAKYDLNTFEDKEQLESNTVPTYPKINHRTSIGLSSNFSFAIEIGRRVVPINPIESVKRHSPIFKAKKIKSPINYDSNNYIQRNNKSKASVINTMVKRCMCTLNLTKQRNRNKSMNEQFAPNVYTVNTLLTSNIASVLAKAMSEKKLPCQIPTNEYKIWNVSNSYAAWHSQMILYNDMQLSLKNNVTSKQLLKQLKSQLKRNNLYHLSKSLSFLSDTDLKKTWLVAGAPWQFAERKTVLCESSESKLYHVSEHQTFIKSSQYWEKTYCTMNLKTIYSRNGKTKDRIQKESRNNSVRVGSNISLNIKFYKDNPCFETKHDILPATITRKDDSLRSKMTPNAITSSNKASYSVPKDQRCFCTMKLQNKSHGKNVEVSKQEPSKVTLKPAVSYVSRSQNTPGTKINTISLEPQEQLLPRECIPDMCGHGECDPASCYKLYKRKLKTRRSISAATKTTRKVQAGVLTQQPSFKNAKIQSQRNSHKKRNEQVYMKRQSAVPYDYIDSGKRCSRFGSQIGFNVEFYKESVPTSKNYDHELYGKKYDKSSKHINETSVTTKTLDLRPSKSSARRGDSLIKRCFCTLKLRNKQKKPLLTEVHSVGVMAGVKNKWYSDKVLSNKESSNKENATSVYNTTSILRKPKQSLKNENVTKSKHGRQHITMAALLPYECEPGICDPGACNPYECLQRIETRKLIRKNIGSGTSRLSKKSLGTSSKFGIPSKHRRIQTVSFQQTDIGVSRAVPKKAKPKNDKSSSNNRCVRIGSSINFGIEFFKDNCDRTLRHKTNKDADVVKTSSRSHKPVMNTKAIMSNFKTKRKGTKHANESPEPIVNIQVSSKKQTASQLSQTRRKYFSKNKGLLPYECEPNKCIPGQCDPYKCYERIQKRIYKDRSAITVSNVRDFATNATTYCECKSKRIQTDHHYREDATDGMRFKKKSVPDHKSRKYMRIGSNFGFHIEFGKKEVDGLREVPVDDDEYSHKKVHRRLHEQASQSQHVKRRSQSTFARSKLRRCFCTKKLFNSSAKTAIRNLEYTTNCALVSNIVPTVNPIYNIIDNNRGSQHFARLEKQMNIEVSTRHNIKNNLRPKRLLKFRRNTSKILNQYKMRSYLSFDLDFYKSKKFTIESLNKYQKKIRSNPNVIVSKEKSNIKRLKDLKTIDSKSIEGQGDTEKTVNLKRCFSTFNFSTCCEKKCKSEQGLVKSRYENIQQELEKRYRMKYIFTDTSAAKNFHPPHAKIIKLPKINKSLFKANKIVFFYKCPDDYILSTKKNLVEIKKYYSNCNEDNKEKNNYFRNIYSKLHPYLDKINFMQFFKNIKSRRHGVKAVETNR